MPRLDKSQVRVGTFLTGAPCAAQYVRDAAAGRNFPNSPALSGPVPSRARLDELAEERRALEARLAELKRRIAELRKR